MLTKEKYNVDNLLIIYCIVLKISVNNTGGKRDAYPISSKKSISGLKIILNKNSFLDSFENKNKQRRL